MANEIIIENSETRKSRMSGILWGMAKCGKTTFTRSLPGKKLYAMLDPDGDQSIPDDDDISIIRLYDQPDDVILRYCEDKLPALLAKNEGKFDSFIFDSTTTFYQVCMNEAIRKGVGASSGPKGFTPTLDAPGLSAYGSRGARTVNVVNKLLRATSQSGMHCWFTTHQDEAKTDDKGNFLYITMMLSGKTINSMGLQVSEIWHMRNHDGKWFIAIAPCRGKQPMGSRIFDVTGQPEFELKFKPELGSDQPHSLARWYQQWVDGGKNKLPLPK